MRNSSTVRMLIVLLLTLSLAPALWASADGEEAATSAEKEYVIDPTTGLEVLKPQYGGTITWVSPNDPPHTDSWIIHHVAPATDGVVEMLAHGNWGVDRSVHDLRARPTPTWLLKGNVAESWSLPDATTIVFKIRQNIFWHDKEPMNGRQLTAKDVEWNFHRYLGLGSGFTKPSAAATYRTLPWESVTATDDFTVVSALDQRRSNCHSPRSAPRTRSSPTIPRTSTRPRWSSNTATCRIGAIWSAPGRGCWWTGWTTAR